jgi:hypothetical protein
MNFIVFHGDIRFCHLTAEINTLKPQLQKAALDSSCFANVFEPLNCYFQNELLKEIKWLLAQKQTAPEKNGWNRVRFAGCCRFRRERCSIYVIQGKYLL